MATLAVTTITKSGISAAVTFTEATGDDLFAPGNADQRVTVLLNNTDTNAATVVFKAADGLFGNLGDITVSVPASTMVAVPLVNLESARVKNITTANKGLVELTETATTLSKLLIGIVSVI